MQNPSQALCDLALLYFAALAPFFTHSAPVKLAIFLIPEFVTRHFLLD